MGAFTVLESLGKFIRREAVLCIAAVCAVISMILVPPDELYQGYIDLQVLCLLLCLMAVVAGLNAIGVFRWLTFQLLNRIYRGPVLSVILVLLPFFCAMLITNDVALLLFVPFTLGLFWQMGLHSVAIPVLVLQTIAANLGSMATPVGNPQNIFLYAAYGLSAAEFFSVVLPIVAVSFVALTVAALPILPKRLPSIQLEPVKMQGTEKLLIYAALFGLCLLTVFRIVPYWVTTVLVLVIVFCIDRPLLRQLDFALLATFVCFFIVSGNLARIDAVRTFLQDLLQRNALLTAAGTSQIISNVPAAVLLSGFTDEWRPLLEGVNIGGLGTPIASLASLITLKLYLRSPEAKGGRFIGMFMLANVVGLAVLLGFAWIF